MRRDYNRDALERMGREGGLDDLVGEVYDVEIPNEHPANLVDNDADIQNVDPLIPGPFRDDFTEQMRQRARSHIGPRGETLTDDFDQKFQVQEEERAALAEEAMPVQVNPLSASKGTLGGHGRVIVAVPGNNPIGIAFWQGADDVESRAVVVTISPTIPEVNEAGTLIYRPFARVDFGTRGQHSVEVDIGRGVQFPVSGAAVRVAVGLDDGSTVTDMEFEASLSFASYARPTVITRTLYGATQDGGTTVEFEVPNFARDVILHRATTSTAMRLDFKDSAGNVRYSIALAAGVTQADPIRLGGDIVLVDVVNTAGGGTLSGVVTLVFGLAL